MKFSMVFLLGATFAVLALPGLADEPEAAPAMRTWTDSSGAFTLEAEFVGVDNGKVALKKSDGKELSVALERLSKEDQDYVKGQTLPAGKVLETKELVLDDAVKAGMQSIAGGGHAVAFQVDGDSWYVTSVSLHGSRYGLPKPPKEDFRVFICDEDFKPITTFKFPYASYARGEQKWVSFRVKPTKVPPKFVVCFAFDPEATKGVYVSMDKEGSGKSFVAVPGELDAKPFAKGDWMIRCKVEKRTN